MAMRWLAAVGVLVSGLAHFYLWADGFRVIAWIGPLFMLNAVAAVLIAVLVVWWRSWVTAALAVGFGAATLAAFLLSTTVGLLGLHEIFFGTWQMVAGVAEIVAVVAGLVAWRQTGWLGSRDQAQHGVAARGADLH